MARALACVWDVITSSSERGLVLHRWRGDVGIRIPFHKRQSVIDAQPNDVHQRHKPLHVGTLEGVHDVARTHDATAADMVDAVVLVRNVRDYINWDLVERRVHGRQFTRTVMTMIVITIPPKDRGVGVVGGVVVVVVATCRILAHAGGSVTRGTVG